MRAFLAVHDPRHADDVELAGRVEHALDGDRAIRTLQRRSLTLGWIGDGEPSLEPFCFLDGVLYGDDGDRPEVRLAAAHRREGEAMLGRLRGDFALLFYDASRDDGLVARDHLGGRGVYWHHAGTRTIVASEVRYVLALLASRPPVDDVTMAHWLGLSGVPTARTFHAGINRLENAHALHFGRGQPRPKRYWTPVYRRPIERSRAELVAGLRAALEEAVCRRSRPGEQTALLLSGGLDSSTVAALASQLDADRRPARAYSATFPDHPTVDEGTLIDGLCTSFGLAGTRAEVRAGSVVGGAIEYIDHWQLPPPSPNLFFWFPLLRRAAADGTSVLLDGEGGDELFGLSPYLLADRIMRGQVRAAADLVRRMPGSRPDLPRSAVWPFMREFGFKGVVPRGLHRARRGRNTLITPEWLLPATRAVYVDNDVAADWKQLPGPRWWAYLVDVVTRGMGAAMCHDHVRRRAAVVGIDARHPLVDVDVVEYVLGLPPEAAFDTRHSRPLVREAMAGLLPDSVRLRAGKSSFDEIFHYSLGGADLAVVRELLRPGEAEVESYVDLSVVAATLLVGPPAGQRTAWANALWRLVTAECWLRSAAGRPVRTEHFGQSAILIRSGPVEEL